MNYIELIIIGIGLGMDACSMAVCKGLSMTKMSWNKAVIISLYFGIFQFIMPVIGFILANSFGSSIQRFDHIIAFILLCILGFNMIKEASNSIDSSIDDDVSFKKMIIPSIATSIDALTVGVTFSLFNVNILFAGIIILVITFVLSLIGVKIGHLFGEKYRSKAQIIGGLTLIIMGFNMLI